MFYEPMLDARKRKERSSIRAAHHIMQHLLAWGSAVLLFGVDFSISARTSWNTSAGRMEA